MMAAIKERVLITGGSGLLGSTIARMAAGSYEVYAAYHSHPKKGVNFRSVPLDITDRQSAVSIINEIRPALIFHTAALVDVDYCQDHEDEAWATNVKGTENIVLASKEVGAKLIYISTDSVFDGKKGMYTEEDVTGPVNIYAATKLESEKIVRAGLPDSVVVRTAFYGWSPANGNRMSLANWVVSELREKKHLDMFTDVFFSPILMDNLCEAMIEISNKDHGGVYHIAGSTRCSKHAFGLEIARVFGLDTSLIRPSSIAAVNLKAPRPRDISLDITKISGIINTRLLNLSEGIKKFRDSEGTVKGA